MSRSVQCSKHTKLQMICHYMVVFCCSEQKRKPEFISSPIQELKAFYFFPLLPTGWYKPHHSVNFGFSSALLTEWTEGDLTSDLHCHPLFLQGESGEELSPVSSDWLPDLTAGQRTSVCSTGSEDTMPSPITRQLSGSKCTSVSLWTRAFQIVTESWREEAERERREAKILREVNCAMWVKNLHLGVMMQIESSQILTHRHHALVVRFSMTTEYHISDVHT